MERKDISNRDIFNRQFLLGSSSKGTKKTGTVEGKISKIINLLKIQISKYFETAEVKHHEFRL